MPFPRPSPGGAPHTGPRTIAMSGYYVLELRSNGRLWMLGQTGSGGSAPPSSWCSCLVLEGARDLDPSPYVAQSVAFDRLDAPARRRPTRNLDAL